MSRKLSNSHMLLAAAAAALAMTASRAQAQLVINFDETGKATFVNPNGVVTSIPSLGNIVDPFDPASGIQPLAYNMAGVFPGVVPVDGDINLFEPTNPTNAPPSDLLRWFHGLLMVYSDLPEAGEIAPPADVGLPFTRQQNLLNLPETGPETGPNGLFGYIAAPGLPGSFPASAGPVTYNFLSDPAVPEPHSIAAVAMGACALLARRRRRRGHVAAAESA